jgi:hypothetical protein
MTTIKFDTKQIAQLLIEDMGSEIAYRKAVRIAHTWIQRYERTNDINDRKMANNWSKIHQTIGETV